MYRRQHEVTVFVAQLLVPVLGVACSAESVHGDAGESEPVGASPGSDAVDRAHDLADTVGGPRARFGDDECPVGGKEAVDGEKSQRGRTVDDDQLVRHPLEGHRQAVVRPDRIHEELGFAQGERRCGGDNRRWSDGTGLGGPTAGQSESGDRAGPLLGEGVVDGERRFPDSQPGGGVALRVKVDHEGVDTA